MPAATQRASAAPSAAYTLPAAGGCETTAPGRDGLLPPAPAKPMSVGLGPMTCTLARIVDETTQAEAVGAAKSANEWTLLEADSPKLPQRLPR